MTLNIGRAMTDDDREKLTKAAQRFNAKWASAPIEGVDPVHIAQDAPEFASCEEDARDMAADWKRRVKRALGGYTAWGYGYVGHSE